MRYLCIDLGDKRTGLAMGDSITRLATPLIVVEMPREQEGGAALLRALTAQIEHHVGVASKFELVCGLPINIDGTEGPRAKLTRAFAQRLAAQLNRPLHFQDERLTSDAADRSLAGKGLTRKEKKSRADAVAAAVILQDFLSALEGGRQRLGLGPPDANPNEQ